MWLKKKWKAFQGLHFVAPPQESLRLRLKNDEQVADDSCCHLCSILEFMKYFHLCCPVWSSERTCEVVITISISGQKVDTVEIILWYLFSTPNVTLFSYVVTYLLHLPPSVLRWETEAEMTEGAMRDFSRDFLLFPLRNLRLQVRQVPVI